MRGWVVDGDAEPDGSPELGVRLRPAELPEPQPAPGEVRVRVSACGVCRTDLHLAEGDLPPRRPGVVPGHEVVGGSTRWARRADGSPSGDRVGIAWLRHTCGRCRFCRRGAENLCPHHGFTGWDADGGYAEYAVVAEAFAYRLPDGVRRRRRRAAAVRRHHRLPRAAPGRLPPGGRLGHLRLRRLAPTSPRRSRSPEGGDRARADPVGAGARAGPSLGAASRRGAADDAPPEPLDAAILFAPAGELVPAALRGARPRRHAGRRRHPPHRHPAAGLPATTCSEERQLRSVTANTRADGEEFLRLAGALGVRPTVQPRPLSAARRTLEDLARDAYTGAAVLVPDLPRTPSAPTRTPTAMSSQASGDRARRRRAVHRSGRRAGAPAGRGRTAAPSWGCAATRGRRTRTSRPRSAPGTRRP